MKLTHEELWHIVRSTEWLESGEDNPDRETKAQDKKYRKLNEKIKKFYEKHEKASFDIISIG